MAIGCDQPNRWRTKAPVGLAPPRTYSAVDSGVRGSGRLVGKDARLLSSASS